MKHPPKEIQAWDTLWMSMCYMVAMKSKDRSTKVGCIIVDDENTPLQIGYNGPPRGMADDKVKYHMRPYKYLVFEHAERNAFYNATRTGTSLKDATLYITWMPCADCARGIIQTGVKKVIVHKQGQAAYDLSREGADIHSWEESADAATEMLTQTGVTFQWYDGPIMHRTFATFSGKHYQFCGPENKPIECGVDCDGTSCNRHECWACQMEYE